VSASERKVLLIRLSSLGDVVLATSALEALGRDVPGVKVDVLTKPEFAEVFDNNPMVNEVLLWPPALSPLAIAAKLRRARYDLIVDLHANLRTRLLKLLTRGKWSVYGKGALARRLAVRFRVKSLIAKAPHVAARYAAALAGVGVQGQALPRLYITEEERAEALKILKSSGWDGETPLVALAPGARWNTKAWPEENWREVCHWVRELEGEGIPGEAGFFPVLIGGGSEAALASRVLGDDKGANLAGKCTIRVTGAVLEYCRGLVSNDSAPRHISVAVGTPVVAVFGPTVRQFGFTPLGPCDRVVEARIRCRPCSLHGDDACPQEHFKCMQEVETWRVLEALTGVLRCEHLGIRIRPRGVL